jgi:hypothetical protein
MDTYYHPKDLGKFADMGKGNKDLWDKFMSYYSAVFAEGALTEREKALIALGVAHGVQCPYCIDAYTQAAGPRWSTGCRCATWPRNCRCSCGRTAFPNVLSCWRAQHPARAHLPQPLLSVRMPTCSIPNLS